MTGRDPKPSPHRLGRAGVAVVAILAVTMLLVYVGRIIWHADSVHEDPPEIQQTQQP